MKVQTLEDLFKDPSIRMIGVIGDPNTGKSQVIYRCIKTLQEKYITKMYSYGLKVKLDGVQDIHMIEELEKIHDSVIFIDEFPSLFRLSNRRAKEDFEESMRKIYHSNNIVIICGLPHNFDKFLSGLLNAIVFKQSTIVDFIQRSPVERIIKSYSGGYQVQKGNRVLTMSNDIALIYDGEHFVEVDVKYVEEGDSKRFNMPILTPKKNGKKD